MIALFASLAVADVVGPDPACPAYAVPRVSHGGEWCEPAAECQAGTCAEGGTCRGDVGICVVTEEAECGGLQPDTGEPCTFIRRTALGRCSSQADCSEGTCEVADRCMTEGPFACGGCDSRGAGGSVFGLALLAIAARPYRRATRA